MSSFEVLLMVCSFFAFIALQVPVAIALGTVLFLCYYIMGFNTIELVMDAYQSLDSFPLLAIPMFILAGTLMATGGVAKRILGLADEFVGHLPGGLAIVTIFACLLFGGLSGSAPATVAAIGAITIPEMIKQGYGKGFAAGVTACSGVIAILVPPSNPMIIYSLSQPGTSVSAMFLSGILPGFLLALGIAIPAYWVSKKNGWGGTRAAGTWGTRGKAIYEAKWAILTPVIILGGIYSGVFTPTESAAVASLYAFIIGMFVHKEIKVTKIFDILSKSAIMSVVAMFLIPFAVALGKLLSSQQVPELMTHSLSGFMDGKVATILLIILLLLFIGCFMDTLASIIVLTPLLYPLVSQYGISTYHFGIILIVCLGLGFVTPPLGGNLFIANQISRTSVQSVFIGALPTLGGMLVAALLIAFIPQISEAFL
ncbi:TRAP transporter large permease [Marinomonas spartinae]|uniref:TRAP transporter large permease n=1 Tax=Marinomonas spartinae TaxID=1792290 RepID=UPI0018F1ECE2|nr:TRAP transporter large permease [Marinomonas spartinae]MBJ7556609.1 TRAP transporter large permease [Marinomonas spartinae]